MPVSFHAKEVSVDRKEWGLIVTLAGESTDDEDFYLMLQRKKLFNARDHELGMADVYIEYCGQGMSWYGHIDSFRLLKESVEVQLSAAAAAEKQNDGKVVVSFNSNERTKLQTAFREVFEGRAYYTD
jgi:hypothetical protein